MNSSQSAVVEKIKTALLNRMKWKGDFAILKIAPKVQLPLNIDGRNLCIVFQEKFGQYVNDDYYNSLLQHNAKAIAFNTCPIWTRLDIARNHEILFKTKGFEEDFWIYTIKEASESRAMKMHLAENNVLS